MSGFGKSSSSSKGGDTTSTTTNLSQPINVQPGGNGGVSQGYTSAGGDVNTSATTYDLSTDGGAIASNAATAAHTIDAATTLNQQSSALVKSIAQSALDFSAQQNGEISDALTTGNQNSLSFAGRALDSVDSALSGNATLSSRAFSDLASANSSALSDVAASDKNALSTVSDLFSAALSGVADAFSGAATLQSKAIDSVSTGTNNALQVAAASTSSTYASTQTVKYVLYGLGAVAVAIAAIVILGRKS